MKNNKKMKNNTSKSNKEARMKSSQFDPFGSYTGVPADGGKPVQDQDDL